MLARQVFLRIPLIIREQQAANVHATLAGIYPKPHSLRLHRNHATQQMIVWSCGHTILCSRSQCRTLLFYLKLSQWRLDAHWVQMTDPKMHTHSSTVTRSVQSRCFCFCVTLYKMRISKIRTLPSFTHLWRVVASPCCCTHRNVFGLGPTHQQVEGLIRI